MKYLLFLTLIFSLSACYRMPEDGEVSTIPFTNNPDMTHQSGQWNPGIEC